MARNGSGTYSLVAGNPVVTGTTISSTTHNNTMTDIETALTNSVDKDGQTVITGIIDHNGLKIILDADADTSITADTDDEIDIEVAGADDFKILANIFRALSGSVLESNTINETTSATGVTIDGLLVQDGDIIPSYWNMYNALDNGDFRVDQRKLGSGSYTSGSDWTNSDGNTLIDRWVLLSDGNNIFDVQQNGSASTLPPGALKGCRLDVETEDKKGGILQIIENRETERLLKNGAGVCSLSFWAETTDATNYTLIRAAVVEWTSTADAPTVDIVSAWNAEGTNPTLVTNWAYANTPAALTALTATSAEFKIENITLNDSSTNNIGVFIWMDDMTNSVTNKVTIGDVQLNPGAKALPFIPKSYGQELLACQRHMVKYQNDESNNENLPCAGTVVTTSNSVQGFFFPVEMRTEPTVQVSDATHIDVTNGGSNTVASGVAFTSSSTGRKVAKLSLNTGATLVEGEGATARFEGTETGGSQWILATAEF